MNISRIEINTIDRPYMTYDVSGVFVRHQLDVMWMEVYTHVIYIKLEKLSDETKEVIFKEIMDIDGVKAVKEVNLLLFEEKEIEINNKNYLLSMSKMLSEEGLIGYRIPTG